MPLPKVLYAQTEKDGDSTYVVAWEKLKDANDGKVGVYRLEDELQLRTVPEVRRKGTKKWFKPE